MKREVKLYNVLFPIWILMFFPQILLPVLLGNFLIDSAVVLLVLRKLRGGWAWAEWKRSILRVWGLGFLSDIAGAAVMLLPLLLSVPLTDSSIYPILEEQLLRGIMLNPFHSVWSFLWTTLAVAVSSLCIYYFGRHTDFNRTTLSDTEKRRLALVLAIITAPWLFYIPIAWV